MHLKGWLTAMTWRHATRALSSNPMQSTLYPPSTSHTGRAHTFLLETPPGGGQEGCSLLHGPLPARRSDISFGKKVSDGSYDAWVGGDVTGHGCVEAGGPPSPTAVSDTPTRMFPAYANGEGRWASSSDVGPEQTVIKHSYISATGLASSVSVPGGTAGARCDVSDRSGDANIPTQGKYLGTTTNPT